MHRQRPNVRGPGRAAGSREADERTTAAQPKATFVSRHAGFVKKSIDQLAVLKELNGLLCLSGAPAIACGVCASSLTWAPTAGDVTLHELPSFALIASFSPHTKGAASHFSISSNVSKVDGRAPEIHSTLAAACRRRLVLLRWLDGEWRTPHEVALPHQIRSMSFASSERTRQINLVAGFSTGEYGIVYMPSTSSSGSAASQPTLSELFVPRIPQSSAPAQSSTQDSPTATSAPSTSFGLGSFGKSANIFSGALALGGRKLAENRVALVPRWKGKRPARENERAGAVAWLYDDHLWVNGEDDLEDQVLVVRNGESMLKAQNIQMLTPLQSRHGHSHPQDISPDGKEARNLCDVLQVRSATSPRCSLTSSHWRRRTTSADHRSSSMRPTLSRWCRSCRSRIPTKTKKGHRRRAPAQQDC